MAGWHHRLDGREFGWTPGVGDGQGGLACCRPWGCQTQLNNSKGYSAPGSASPSPSSYSHFVDEKSEA